MKISETFTVREIAGDYIMVPLGESALRFSGIVSTNEVGSVLWKELEQGADMARLVSRVTEEFDVETSVAQEDVEQFVDMVRKLGILEEQDETERGIQL